MDRDNSFRQQLLSELGAVKTVDCHSHTHLRRSYYEAGGFDLFSLTSYFERDIVSTAGDAIYQGAKTDEERWLRLEKVLRKSRNVSYWRHNLVVYRKLFGLEETELTNSNWKLVNESIRQKSQDPLWYDYVTKDLCQLETQIRNIPWFEDWEEEYFTGVLRMKKALALHEAETREELEQYMDVSMAV